MERDKDRPETQNPHQTSGTPGRFNPTDQDRQRREREQQNDPQRGSVGAKDKMADADRGDPQKGDAGRKGADHPNRANKGREGRRDRGK